MTLLVLRLGIGWHFWREGVSKMEDPQPFSAGFLSNAKGPLASSFQSMIWDADGVARLDFKATSDAWDQYRERVANHYQFDDRQYAEAAKVFDNYQKRLRWYIGANAEDINKYYKGLDRRDKNRADTARTQVASLSSQSTAWEADLRKQRATLLGPIDEMWVDYQRQLNGLATDEQQARGELALRKPGRRFFDSEFVDWFIPYFDMGIGVLLILGLFTRTASIVAALFLASVISTQIFGGPGAVPVYYQTVEMLALLVLAAVGAGRIAGLDSIIRAGRLWCCPPKEEATA